MMFDLIDFMTQRVQSEMGIGTKVLHLMILFIINRGTFSNHILHVQTANLETFKS